MDVSLAFQKAVVSHYFHITFINSFLSVTKSSMFIAVPFFLNSACSAFAQFHLPINI